jgi:hypothetical protein
MTILDLRRLAAACVLAASFVPAALAAEPGACTARHTETWKAGSDSLTVDAVADGTTCTGAVAMLVIRGADGTPLWHQTYVAGQVMVLADQPDVASMKQALTDWTVQNTSMATTKTLPEWKPADDFPINGEFVFYVEEGIDRAAYADVRKADLPMYCYVQGMESMACVVLQDGGLFKVGVQTFPG